MSQHQQSNQKITNQDQAPTTVSVHSTMPTQADHLHNDMDLISAPGPSPPGSYSSIPPRSNNSITVPPILPPHLLQVILNHPDKANATILPQPNHVMLNHLYALSIKDGIMVLSATHRFRRKYVTTLLYKPI